MASIKINLGGPERIATLTTDHPLSSYGQPVLIDVDGAIYGPGDIYSDDFFGRETAAEYVAKYIVGGWPNRVKRPTEEDRARYAQLGIKMMTEDQIREYDDMVGRFCARPPNCGG